MGMSADAGRNSDSRVGYSENRIRSPEILADYFSARMDAAFACVPPGDMARIGVAVSGGGDSTALLLLLSRWSRENDVELVAASVDHGLRPEAQQEIEEVRLLANSLGLAHSTLSWRGGAAKGNLQEAARCARYGLLEKWAADVGAISVALGHTEDDQAETFLLRLARGSGVDGLACMSESALRRGIQWLRPLLGIRRQELRDYLESNGIRWSEDSSNENLAFDRIKIRKAMRELETAGLSVPRLSATARQMRMAKEALQASATRGAIKVCSVNGIGDLIFSIEIWRLEEETRCRIFAQAAMYLAGRHYRPRFRSLLRVLDAVAAGGRATLAGCMFEGTRGGDVLVGREPAFCEEPVAPGAVWDGRWQMERIAGDGVGMVGPLGESGLARCPQWKETGYRKSSLAASPSVWNHGDLVSAPLAAFANGWRANLLLGKDEFLESLASY